MNKEVLLYILIGLSIYFVINSICRFTAFHYRQNYEARKKRREEYQKEQMKWKYCTVSMDNPLLRKITQSRFIVFKGDWGTGKSIMMNVVAHYIYETRMFYDKKNARYNSIMNSNYLQECKQLEENKQLPVYSNMELIDSNSQCKSQDILPYICLQKRAVQKPVFCIDEFASLFPKEMYYEVQREPNALVEEMKELFKKFRHYTNGWILGTEQDGEDIFIGFRKNGYALITALGTIVQISKLGKFKRKMKNLFNSISLALFSKNLHLLYEKQLFRADKIKFYFKIFLPLYYAFPEEYYRKKQEINNKIKEKYQKYKTKILYEGAEWYITYTNKGKFAYDTRVYKHEYDEKFDKSGERKVYNA